MKKKQNKPLLKFRDGRWGVYANRFTDPALTLPAMRWVDQMNRPK